MSFLSLPAISWAENLTPATQQADTVASVTVANVMLQNMVGQVSVSGTLVPQEEILIFPQVSGPTIETLLVDIGDTVSQGQVLAALNNSNLTAQLAQAQAEFTRAEAGFRQAQSQITSAEASETQVNAALNRARSLSASGSGTQAALDVAVANAQTAASAVALARDELVVAEAQTKQAQAQLDIATLNLDRATLRAPADGLISVRNGQVGGIASSGGEPIFLIVRDSVIEVEVEEIETALGTISVGDSAHLRISGNGEVDGIVRRIAPSVDARTRLGAIRIEIADNGKLRAGAFVGGDVISEQRRSLAVPTTSILTDIGGTYVLVVADGRLGKRPVAAGLIWNNMREIVSGLSEREVVVARAGAFFGDGDIVIPIFPESYTIVGAAE